MENLELGPEGQETQDGIPLPPKKKTPPTPPVVDAAPQAAEDDIPLPPKKKTPPPPPQAPQEKAPAARPVPSPGKLSPKPQGGAGLGVGSVIQQWGMPSLSSSQSTVGPVRSGSAQEAKKASSLEKIEPLAQDNLGMEDQLLKKFVVESQIPKTKEALKEAFDFDREYLAPAREEIDRIIKEREAKVQTGVNPEFDEAAKMNSIAEGLDQEKRSRAQNVMHYLDQKRQMEEVLKAEKEFIDYFEANYEQASPEARASLEVAYKGAIENYNGTAQQYQETLKKMAKDYIIWSQMNGSSNAARKQANDLFNAYTGQLVLEGATGPISKYPVQLAMQTWDYAVPELMQGVADILKNPLVKAAIPLGNSPISINDAMSTGLEYTADKVRLSLDKNLYPVQSQGTLMDMNANKATMIGGQILGNILGTVAIGGGARAIGMTGKALAGAEYASSFVYSYSGPYRAIKQADPSIDDWKAHLFATMTAAGSAALEKAGIDEIYDASKVTNPEALRRLIINELALAKTPQDVIKTAQVFLSAVGRGGLGEGSTEALQAIWEFGTQEGYNAITGTNTFDNNVTDVTESMIENFALGFGAGAAMTGLSYQYSPESIYDLAKKKDPEQEAEFFAMVQSMMDTGRIGEREAKILQSRFNNAKMANDMVPETSMEPELADRAGSLIAERLELQQEMEGKDPSLVKAIKYRIDDINRELNAIGENTWTQEDFPPQIYAEPMDRAAMAEQNAMERDGLYTTEAGEKVKKIDLPVRPKKKPDMTTTVEQSVGQTVNIDGRSGVVKVVGQTVEVHTDDDKIYEIGNFDQIKGKTAFEAGMEVRPVKALQPGVFEVRGQKYKTQTDPPLKSINYGKDGKVKSVSMVDSQGKRVTVRGTEARNIAAEIEKMTPVEDPVVDSFVAEPVMGSQEIVVELAQPITVEVEYDVPLLSPIDNDLYVEPAVEPAAPVATPAAAAAEAQEKAKVVRRPSISRQQKDISEGKVENFQFETIDDVPSELSASATISKDENGKDIIVATIPTSLADYYRYKKESSQPQAVKAASALEDVARASGIRSLYEIYRNQYNLPRNQALADAVLSDRMMRMMAEREGVDPKAIYDSIVFAKAMPSKPGSNLLFQQPTVESAVPLSEINPAAIRPQAILPIMRDKVFVGLEGKKVSAEQIYQFMNRPGIKPIEQKILKFVADNYIPKGQKIDYSKFKLLVSDNIAKLDHIATTTYADYGLDKVNLDQFPYETVLLNSEVPHNLSTWPGFHFERDYDRPQDVKYKYNITQLSDGSFVAIREDMPPGLSDPASIMQYVGTAGTEQTVKEWIDRYTQARSGSQLPAGYFAHVRLAHDDGNGVTYVTEMQSDFYQKLDPKEYYGGKVISIEERVSLADEIYLAKMKEYYEAAVKDFNLIDGDVKVDGYSVDFDSDAPKIKVSAFYTKASEKVTKEIVVGRDRFAYGSNAYMEGVAMLSAVEIAYQNLDPMSKASYAVITTPSFELMIKPATASETYKDSLGKANSELARRFDEQMNSSDLPPEKQRKVIMDQQMIALNKTFMMRTAREAIKRAMEKGSTVVRFPTPMTISKIESYDMVDESGNRLSPGELEWEGPNDPSVGDAITYYGDDYIVIDINSYSEQMTVVPRDNVMIFDEQSEKDYFTSEYQDSFDRLAERYGVNMSDPFDETSELSDLESLLDFLEDSDSIDGNYHRKFDRYYKKEIESIIDDVKALIERKTALEENPDIEFDQEVRSVDFGDVKRKFNEFLEELDIDDLHPDATYIGNGDSYMEIESKSGSIVLSTFIPEGSPDEDEAMFESFNEDNVENDNGKTVVKKYREFAKALKKERPDLKFVRSEDGHGWLETQIQGDDLDASIVAFQESETYGQAKGAAQIFSDKSAIIYSMTNPDVTTPLHELAHVFEKYLSRTEKAQVLAWANAKKWDTAVSEKFARGFEKYLSEGKAPSQDLQGVFDRFKRWMLDIYNDIVGSDIDVELNDAMRDLYSNMLAKKKPKAKETPEKAKPVSHAKQKERQKAVVASSSAEQAKKVKQSQAKQKQQVINDKLDKVKQALEKLRSGASTPVDGGIKYQRPGEKIKYTGSAWQTEEERAYANAMYDLARAVIDAYGTNYDKVAKAIRDNLRASLQETIDDKSLATLIADALNDRSPQQQTAEAYAKAYDIQDSALSKVEVSEGMVVQRVLDSSKASSALKDILYGGSLEYAVEKRELAKEAAELIVSMYGESGAKELVSRGVLKGAVGAHVLGSIVDAQVLRKAPPSQIAGSIDMLSDYVRDGARRLGAMTDIYVNSPAGIFATVKRAAERANAEVASKRSTQRAASATDKAAKKAKRQAIKEFNDSISKYETDVRPAATKQAKEQLDKLREEAGQLKSSIKERMAQIRANNAGITPVVFLPVSPAWAAAIQDKQLLSDVLKLAVNLVKRGYYSSKRFNERIRSELSALGLNIDPQDADQIFQTDDVADQISKMLSSGAITPEDLLAAKIKDSNMELDYKVRQNVTKQKKVLTKIIEAGIDDIEKLKTTIVDSIVRDIGLDPTAAKTLSDKLMDQLTKMIDAAVEKELQKRIDRYSEKNSQKQTPAQKRVQEAGVLDSLVAISKLPGEKSASYAKALSVMFGGINVTPEVEARLMEYATRLSKAGDGLVRDSVAMEMNVYLNSLFDTSMVQKYWALYYPQQLAGLTTQAINVLSSFYNISSDKLARAGVDFGMLWNMGIAPVFNAYGAKARNAKTAFTFTMKTGVGSDKWSDMQSTVRQPGKNKSIEDEIFTTKIGQAWGTLLKYFPTRFMVATDAMFHAYAHESHLYRNIYLEERAKGLSGDALKAAVNDRYYGTPGTRSIAMDTAEELVEGAGYSAYKNGKMTPEMQRTYREQLIKQVGGKGDAAARASANRVVWRQQPPGTMGILAKGVKWMLTAAPITRWLVPYVNIPFNIVSTLLDYDPIIGGARLLSNRGAVSAFIPPTVMKQLGLNYSTHSRSAREAVGDEYYNQEYSMQRARWMMGTATMLLAMGFFGLDDDENDDTWITGSARVDKYGQRETKAEYTISIGGVKIPYEGTPLFIPLSIIGNSLNHIRNNRAKSEDAKNEAMVLMAMGLRDSYSGIIDQMPIESLQALAEGIQKARAGELKAEKAIKDLVGGLIRNTTTGVPVIGSNLTKQMSRFYDARTFHKTDAFSFVVGSMGYSVAIPQAATGKEYSRVDHRGREIKSYPGDQFLKYASNLGMQNNIDEIDMFLDSRSANYIPMSSARTMYDFKIDKEVGLRDSEEMVRDSWVYGGKLMDDFLRKSYPILKTYKNDLLVKKIINEANLEQQRYVVESLSLRTSDPSAIVSTSFDDVNAQFEGYNIMKLLSNKSEEEVAEIMDIDLLPGMVDGVEVIGDPRASKMKERIRSRMGSDATKGVDVE